MESAGDKRTARATAAWIRKAENRKADELRERKWMCVPPEFAMQVAQVLADHAPQLTLELVIAIQREDKGREGEWRGDRP